MNKVLLNVFPTQISDERGSIKYKKIIFSLQVFFLKIINYFSQIISTAFLLLPKLTYNKFSFLKWAFFASDFKFISYDILNGSSWHELYANFSSVIPKTSITSRKYCERFLNFHVLNFQK